MTEHFHSGALLQKILIMNQYKKKSHVINVFDTKDLQSAETVHGEDCPEKVDRAADSRSV